MLPTGGVSSIYYADRIYQLPLGVIGIAAGTVLLPEMSRSSRRGNGGAALHAQNRTMALSLALTAPFCIAFLMIPGAIMRGVFLRGAFTAQAAKRFRCGAHGLWFWACRDRLVAFRGGELPSKGRYENADVIALAAVGDQCRFENRAVQAFWRARACRRDGGRRMDQFLAFVLFGDPARRHEG